MAVTRPKLCRHHRRLAQLGRVFSPARPSPRPLAVRLQATAATPKKVKNVEHGRLSGRQGRLHVPKQNLNEMALARPKALRKRAAGSAGGADGAAKRPRKD